MNSMAQQDSRPTAIVYACHKRLLSVASGATTLDDCWRTQHRINGMLVFGHRENISAIKFLQQAPSLVFVFSVKRNLPRTNHHGSHQAGSPLRHGIGAAGGSCCCSSCLAHKVNAPCIPTSDYLLATVQAGSRKLNTTLACPVYPCFQAQGHVENAAAGGCESDAPSHCPLLPISLFAFQNHPSLRAMSRTSSRHCLLASSSA